MLVAVRDDVHRHVSVPRRFQRALRALISDATWEASGPRALERALQAEAREQFPERLARRFREVLATSAQGRLMGTLADELDSIARRMDLRPLGRELVHRLIALASRNPELGAAALDRAKEGVLRDQVACLRRTADSDLARRAPRDRRTMIGRLDAATAGVRFDSIVQGSAGERPAVGTPKPAYDIDADLPRTSS